MMVRMREFKSCEAMEKNGITDPTSKAGIDFCVGECPYDHCVLEEPLLSEISRDVLFCKMEARRMRREGWTILEISKKLNLTRSTIEGYLK